MSKKELHDAFAKGWSIESVEPSRYEVRPDLKEFAFSEGGPRAWFVVVKRAGDATDEAVQAFTTAGSGVAFSPLVPVGVVEILKAGAGQTGKRVRGRQKKLWRNCGDGLRRNKKGLTPIRRKSLCCKVPETGLEPARP